MKTMALTAARLKRAGKLTTALGDEQVCQILRHPASIQTDRVLLVSARSVGVKKWKNLNSRLEMLLVTCSLQLRASHITALLHPSIGISLWWAGLRNAKTW